MRKYKYVQGTHIINRGVERRILGDMENGDVLFICAPIGWGKNVLLRDLYHKLEGRAFWLEETDNLSLEEQLAQLPQSSGGRAIMIPRLEKYIQNKKIEMIGRLLAKKRKEDVFVITSEVPFPKTLLAYTLYYKVIAYGVEDLRPSTEDVGEYLAQKGMNMEQDTLKQMEQDFNNMPLCIFLLENLLLNSDKRYTPYIREKCMEDVYSYLDTMVFHNFKVKEQEQILNLSCLESFDEAEASVMLAISEKQVRALVRRMLDNGSVLEVCRKGWKFENLFGKYLNRVRYKYMDTEEVRRMYRKAMSIAEEKKDWKACLRYAYILDDEELMAGYLERSLQGDVDFKVFLNLEGYFRSLSPHNLQKHPMLVIARAILESINGNLKESAEYEQKFEKRIWQVQDSNERESLQRLLIYRRLIHMGAADLTELTEILNGIRSRSDRVDAWSGKDFQITQLSVLHGEKDYCGIMAGGENGSDVFVKLQELSEGIMGNAFYVIYRYAEVEVLYEQNHLEQAITLLSRTIWEAGTAKNQRMQQVCMITMADLMVARNQLDNIEEFVSQKVGGNCRFGQPFCR